MNTKQGFTIVELLVVIVVVAILALISIVSYNLIQNSAHDTAVKTDLAEIMADGKLYALDHDGKFPSSAPDFTLIDTPVLSYKSYNTTNKSNVYLCLSDDYTEFAVVAMSKSGKRFVAKSEGGITDFNESVVWNATQTNYATTCSAIDPDYDPVAGEFPGYQNGVWLPWVKVI
ncbi:MAG: prepilin-type N-terminal cleavage/methylation domain-containing protein [Candidatus Microsaccharimonas sp.]